MESLTAYIPQDRRYALARGEELPDRMQGAALFADISGFTPLTEMLARTLGPKRGAEELTVYLNRVYDAMITELENYGGSVINFSGDAITCWFNQLPEMSPEKPSHRAVTCALAMQAAMQKLSSVKISPEDSIQLAMKAAISTGSVRRFLVGDPEIQRIDTLAGKILDRLAGGEHLANKGEVLVDRATADLLSEQLVIQEWRSTKESGSEANSSEVDQRIQQYAVISSCKVEAETAPWSGIIDLQIPADVARPLLLRPVFDRLMTGKAEFLAELRPNVALFLRFKGIDYDLDDRAGDKLDEFICHVQRTLLRYDAYVIQVTIGDKGSYLSAAFGAPFAHEDDPVRALSAALDLRKPVLDYIQDIQIGVSKGRMRTGAYGSSTMRTYGMMSDDVNLSARLMQAAAPGQILVNQTVSAGIAHLFIWHELPPIQVKGKIAPIHIFSLIAKNDRTVGRLQEPKYALPMIGRQEELSYIQSLMDSAIKGNGQIVGITGEAGVGKSRLVAEAIHLANQKGFVGYSGEGQSYGKNISYLIWQGIWRSFFGIEELESLDDQIQAIEYRLAEIDPQLVQRLPLLGPVLNLSLPDNDLTRPFDAKLRKSSLEALLTDCLRSHARDLPILLVLEESQWIDPISQDLLELLGRSIANLPVMILLAYRERAQPEAQPFQISQLPYFSEICLSVFTPEESQGLIALKLKQLGLLEKISPEMLKQITERSEGNPFYLEELLNYLHDRQKRPAGGQMMDELDLPASLHSLILTRIDQLTENQKVTLKVASVIGRMFRAAMLFGAYPDLREPTQVVTDLRELSKLDLVLLDEDAPELVYFFKHIITQEAAYESLPFATRAMLHGKLGAFIEKTYAQSLEQYIDLLAYHYYRSEDYSKKTEYLWKAGELAQKNYANTSAIDYFQRLLPLLPEEEQTHILIRLGKVLELVGNWAEASNIYNLALDQALFVSNRQLVAQAQSAQGDLLRRKGHYDEAAEWLSWAHQTFEELGDEAGVGQTLHIEGTLASQQGKFDQARRLYEHSLAIRRKLGDQKFAAALLVNLAIVARLHGDTTTARKLQEEALEIRSQLGDKAAIANSLNNLGIVALDEGNLDEARSRLTEAVTLLRTVGDRWALANSLNNLGNVVRSQGDFSSAQALYVESITINREFGDRRALAYLLEDVGCMAALQNQPERAIHLVATAARLREEINAPLSSAEKANVDKFLAGLTEKINPEMYEQYTQQGRGLSLETAIQMALQAS